MRCTSMLLSRRRALLGGTARRRSAGLPILAITGVCVALSSQPASAAAAPPPGARDLTFGVHGVAQLPSIPGLPAGEVKQPVYVDALALSTGRIWVAGSQGDAAYLTRLNGGGRIDATFRRGKPFSQDLGGVDPLQAKTVIPRPGGGAFIISFFGDLGPQWMVTAVTPHGHTDSRWGQHGTAEVGAAVCQGDPYRCGPSLDGGQVLADGRLRLFGRLGNDVAGGGPPTPVVAGFTRAGAPDTTLGPMGWTRVSEVGVGPAAFDAHGRIYFLGTPVQGPSCDAACASHPGIVRTSTNGVLDASYGTGGVSTLPMPSRAHSWPSALVVSRSGALFAVLGVTLASGREQTRLVSVRSNGAVNTSFGNHGSTGYAPRVGNAYPGPVVATGAGGLIMGITYTGGSHDRYLLLKVSMVTGRLSQAFGSHGAIRLPRPATALLRQSAHRLLVLLNYHRPSWRTELRRYVI